MSGNTVVTAVTLAIRENGSKIAYFLHSARTAHGAPPSKPNPHDEPKWHGKQHGRSTKRQQPLEFHEMEQEDTGVKAYSSKGDVGHQIGRC